MNKEELLEQIEKKELRYDDMLWWLTDYVNVKEEVGKILDRAKDMPIEEQAEYVISKLHRINAYEVCSDTNFKPIEYIDFNTDFLTCTISFYDREVGELLPTADCFIKRDCQENPFPFTDVNMKDVKDLVSEYLVGV